MQRLNEWKRDDNAARIAFWVFVVATLVLGLFAANDARGESPPVIGDVVRAGDTAKKAKTSEPADGLTCEDVPLPVVIEPPNPRKVMGTRPDDAKLHATTARILDVVCGRSVTCRDDRVFAVIQGVSDLFAACADEGVDDMRCMALVVTATAESGFRANPGCGVSEECAATCDEGPNGKDRQTCMVACAKAEKGSVDRARRCNDGGTSRGVFQMKPITVERCGEFDQPHSFYSAGRCYLRLVAASEGNAVSVCGARGRDVWRIAWKRVGAGPFRRGSSDPQCQVSRYAVRGEEWLKGVGDERN